MAKRSQVKGRNAEKELCRLLNDYGYAVNVGHALNFGTEPDLIGLQGIHIESKRCEQLRLAEWMKQAVNDSEKFHDGLPAVFHRKSREDWMVSMRLSDWIKLYEKYIHDDMGSDSDMA